MSPFALLGESSEGSPADLAALLSRVQVLVRTDEPRRYTRANSDLRSDEDCADAPSEARLLDALRGQDRWALSAVVEIVQAAGVDAPPDSARASGTP